MGKRRKILIPIIFVFIFFIAILSGCVDPEHFPIITKQTKVSFEYSHIKLTGEVGVPFCKAKDHMFVYDTESHGNWEDYANREIVDNVPPDKPRINAVLGFNEVQHKVTYFVRAVAYCYDFKKPFDDYEEGYYQGNEQTFYVDY